MTAWNNNINFDFFLTDFGKALTNSLDATHAKQLLGLGALTENIDGNIGVGTTPDSHARFTVNGG